MTTRIDHESAAFSAAMLCFWTLCAIATRWIPQLMVFWEQYPPAAATFKPWSLRTVGSMWLGWGVLFGMSFLRIHWTVADTYKTLIWVGVFALVALIALITAKVCSQGIVLMKSSKDKAH